jgi:RNA polymerase sigma-70 factor (ECF subfamily)
MDDTLRPLLLRIAAQDRAAFRLLYAQSAPKLLGVLIRMLGQRADAEDALQEVFTRVWLRANRFDPERGAAEAWLVTLTRNLAIDRLRARAPASDGDDGLAAIADSAPRAEQKLEAQGQARRIRDCFDQLDPDRSAAVKSAYLDGDSYDDLARRFAVPLNTMRTWLRRGLISLRECMEK